ncbi:hypothetical protein [Orbus mooreae]|uniref:hypothetical protein n=1 Tax=Orbus mooreae TaxID=3074107 RepID=UPI00370D6809
MFDIKSLNFEGLNNIPKSIDIGYHDSNCGKIYNKNGSFILYSNFTFYGEKFEAIQQNHVVGCFNIQLQEIPCDADGNPLLVSYWFERNDDQHSRIVFLFSKEPTHRIILKTGKIIDNNTDNQYIMDMGINYILAQR